MHACSIATELGIGSVVPRYGGGLGPRAAPQRRAPRPPADLGKAGRTHSISTSSESSSGSLEREDASSWRAPGSETGAAVSTSSSTCAIGPGLRAHRPARRGYDRRARASRRRGGLPRRSFPGLRPCLAGRRGRDRHPPRPRHGARGPASLGRSGRRRPPGRQGEEHAGRPHRPARSAPAPRLRALRPGRGDGSRGPGRRRAGRLHRPRRGRLARRGRRGQSLVLARSPT